MMKTYDSLAEVYDDYYTDQKCIWENRVVAEVLAPHLTGEDLVLDVGCGTGLLLDLVQIQNYLGVDPAPNMLSRLLLKHPTARVECARFEDTNNHRDCTVVSLFGSPNYVTPRALALSKFKKYFLMFYDHEYTPSIYLLTNEPLKHYPTLKYIFAGASLFKFSNYLIVTNLELSHADLSRSNGL